MLNSLLYTLLSRKPVGFPLTFDTKGRGFDDSIWLDPSNTLFTFDNSEKGFDFSVWANLVAKSATASTTAERAAFRAKLRAALNRKVSYS